MRIRGFKCFGDSGHIPIAPLTIIVGRNSSGKSSILQPWLLLKQTAETRGFTNTLNLKGPLYDAGAYGEIVHNHDADQSIRLEVDVRIDEKDMHDEGAGLFSFPFFPATLPVAATITMDIAQAQPYGPQLKEIGVDVQEHGPITLQ